MRVGTRKARPDSREARPGAVAGGQRPGAVRVSPRLPAGGVLGARYGWGVSPGLVSLAAALRRNGDGRGAILDHLRRFADHGVAAVMSMGTERPEGYALRDELQGLDKRLAD